jgi:long-chain acyl-CoA synthetase
VEKIWLKNYPHHVPAEINPDLYQSLVQMFEESCTRYPNAPAFYNMGVTLTYAEMDLYSRAIAAYFQQVLKLQKGSRVAIMLPNILQYPVVMFGALRAGLVVVNVNPLYTVPELTHQLQDSQAETLVVLTNFADVVERALPFTVVKNVILTQIGDLLSPLKSWAINFVLKYIKKKIPAYHLPQALQFKAILAQGTKTIFETVDIHNEDIAFLQYTGGTTGVSKGAILSHRNLIANILQAEVWVKSLLDSSREIIITALPLYHIFSLMANCLLLTKLGGLNVLITNPRDTNRMMAKFQFTAITGVNTLFNSLVKHPKFAKLNFKHLKLSLGGGMAVQKAVALKWQAITGVILLEAYGLTETSPCVAINPTDLREYNGTVGLPVSSTDICILADDQHEVPIGECGELGVKGPQVMRGYWQSPLETQKVFTKEGWLLTGDIASVNAEGFLSILERKKDMIIVSGFNVYPNEVENVLAQLPGVSEVAVVGVADENSGEVPKAFIVRDNPNLTVADVIAYCHTKLTHYKVPKQVEFCLELPKTNVGKVLRRALRKEDANVG